MTRTVDPEKVVVATTFECRMPYVSEVEILYRTLAANAGALANARRIACCVGELDSFVERVLSDLGVEVRQVNAFDKRCPHANKLAMLELEDEGDLILALDTDIAFADDPLGWLDGECVQAKIVDHDPVGMGLWPELFKARSVKLPSARYRTDYANAITIPYFNSGVLAIPTRFAQVLREEWASTIHWLLDLPEGELPRRFEDVRFFTDQLALSLALAATDTPVRALPLAMNFPTHSVMHAQSGADKIDPVLVHHHHCLAEDGQLNDCQYPRANQAIERINAELRRDVSDSSGGQNVFDNESFWDARYTNDLSLGSGIGSRGQIAQAKRELLQQQIDQLDPSSIVDVGCGDLEIMRQIRHTASYIGVDISSVVVERNAQLMPTARFVHGEFTKLVNSDEDLSADLVLCMDVLIHQHERDHYERFVQALVKATKRVGIVAAYEQEPAQGYSSEITAWHGPISQLLNAAGAQCVEQIHEYRGTAVMRYLAPER